MNPLTLLQMLSPIIRNMPRSEAKRLILSLKGEGLHNGSIFRDLSLGLNPKRSLKRAKESSRKTHDILELFEEMGGDVNYEHMEDIRDIMANVMHRRGGGK